MIAVIGSARRGSRIGGRGSRSHPRPVDMLNWEGLCSGQSTLRGPLPYSASMEFSAVDAGGLWAVDDWPVSVAICGDQMPASPFRSLTGNPFSTFAIHRATYAPSFSKQILMADQKLHPWCKRSCNAIPPSHLIWPLLHVPSL